MKRARGLLVLAGTSLGSESDAVMRTALRLARQAHGRVHAVHALEPPPLPLGVTGFGLAEPYLAARARGRLQEQLDRVGATAGELAGDTVAVGYPGPVLRAAAERLDADLIVVAAVAAEPMPLHRVRSTVPFLIRQGGCPVVVVKGEVRVPPRRVLAPLDLSSLAAASLRCGLALVTGESIEQPPEVVVLHVLKGGSDETISRSAELARVLEESTADYGGVIRSEVRRGNALAAILAACERERPDLVLVGTHGRSGWQRLRLGSVAEAVILHAPCAVLVVPPAAALAGALAEAIDVRVRSSS